MNNSWIIITMLAVSIAMNFSMWNQISRYQKSFVQIQKEYKEDTDDKILDLKSKIATMQAEQEVYIRLLKAYQGKDKE